MIRRCCPVLLLLAALGWVGLAPAQDSDSESGAADPMQATELLSLAAVLIGDGNYDRARAILARVDLNDEDLDRIRYYTLSGLIALNLDELALAARAFESAIDAGQDEPLVWLYLAQAYFGQQQYSQTLNALDRATLESLGPLQLLPRAHEVGGAPAPGPRGSSDDSGAVGVSDACPGALGTGAVS